MTDIAAIGAAFSTLKGASDLAKLVFESTKSLEKAEINGQLAELMVKLAETQIELSQIQIQLHEKDIEITELQGTLKKQNQTFYEKPHYWAVNNQGLKDGPFCQHCYDKEKLQARLIELETGYWQCKICDNFYTDNNFKPSSSSYIDDEVFA